MKEEKNPKNRGRQSPHSRTPCSTTHLQPRHVWSDVDCDGPPRTAVRLKMALPTGIEPVFQP